MIKRIQLRLTDEDKSKDQPEIFKEYVSDKVYLFGIKIWEWRSKYSAKDISNQRPSKIGYKK